MDLRKQREQAGLTQRDLAEHTGISQAKLSRIEQGKKPGHQDLALIELALAEAPGRKTNGNGNHSPSPARDPYQRHLDAYPSAPTTPHARRQWVQARTAAMQAR